MNRFTPHCCFSFLLIFLLCVSNKLELSCVELVYSEEGTGPLSSGVPRKSVGF